jgi:hypothetical protein
VTIDQGRKEERGMAGMQSRVKSEKLPELMRSPAVAHPRLAPSPCEGETELWFRPARTGDGQGREAARGNGQPGGLPPVGGQLLIRKMARMAGGEDTGERVVVFLGEPRCMNS